MQPGEIFIAKFPFGDVPGMKLRPVLLLTETLGPVSEVLVCNHSPQNDFRSAFTQTRDNSLRQHRPLSWRPEQRREVSG